MDAKEYRSGGCVPGVPVKLGLLGDAAPGLPGDTLVVMADCAAFLTEEERADAVLSCPRQDGEPEAALRALLAANPLHRVRVVTVDTPCCAALEESVRRAAGKRPVEAVRLPVPETPAEAPAPEELPPEAPAAALPPEEAVYTPLERLRFYCAAAFTDDPAAGDVFVAAVQHFPTEEDMRAASAALGAETVCVRPERDGTLSLRSFTAAGERQPLPPAVLAAAGVLRDRERQLWPGTYNVRTRAGFLQINVGESDLWIESGAGPLRRMLEEDERAALCAALGLPDTGTEIRPCLAGGNPQVLLETPSREALMSARPTAKLDGCLAALGAAGVYLYVRAGVTETAVCRSLTPAGEGRPTGEGAGLLAWWLHLLRRAGEECVLRENGAEIRTFVGPDGRLFLGGAVAAAERPVQGSALR